MRRMGKPVDHGIHPKTYIGNCALEYSNYQCNAFLDSIQTGSMVCTFDEVLCPYTFYLAIKWDWIPISNRLHGKTANARENRDVYGV